MPLRSAFLILIIFLSACKEKNTGTGSQADDREEPLVIQNAPTHRPAPISIQEIKSIEGLEVTSGVASDQEEFCYPRTSGFLGFYSLIDFSPRPKPMGFLIIWSPKTDAQDWKFSDNDEEFVQLTVERGPIRLWSQIGIGTSLSQLTKFISTDSSQVTGDTLHHYIEGFVIDYHLYADSVESFTVKKLCI